MAGSTYGRRVDADTTGNIIQVSADGRPEWKSGGITIDWSTLTAVSGADVTLPNGRVVKIGDKYIRYGTVMDLIGTSEVQTIDLSPGADPTGGTWTLTILGNTITGIAYNATGAVLQALIQALNVNGAADVAVTGPTSFVYTVTFPGYLGNVAAMTADGAGMTTATAITIATSTAGLGTGLYGPVDTSASDGRQAMARGESFILNRTAVESDLGSSHAPVFEGGKVFWNRIVKDGTNQPTSANILTAFPRLLRILENS